MEERQSGNVAAQPEVRSLQQVDSPQVSTVTGVQSPVPAPKNVKKKFSFLIAGVALAFLLLLASSVYFWMQAKAAKTATPEAIAGRNQAETAEVIESLGRVMLLRSDQQPTVARIEDPTKLLQTNPDFYKDIQAGDYLVLYPQRAIIFRKSANQVINVAPIVNASDVQKQQSTDDNSEN